MLTEITMRRTVPKNLQPISLLAAVCFLLVSIPANTLALQPPIASGNIKLTPYTTSLKTPQEIVNAFLSMLNTKFEPEERKIGLSAILEEAFDSKIALQRITAIEFYPDDRFRGKFIFEIIIPILQRTFEMSYQPKDSIHRSCELEIKVGGGWIPFVEYIPELKGMLESAEFEEKSKAKEKDLIMRLNSALASENEPEVLDILKEILDSPPNDVLLRGIINAFMPTCEGSFFFSSYVPRASNQLCVRMFYACSLIIAKKFNYILPQDIQGSYLELLRLLGFTKRIEASLEQGGYFIAKYLYENKIGIIEIDGLRKKVLEYFIFKKSGYQTRTKPALSPIPGSFFLLEEIPDCEYLFTLDELASALKEPASSIKEVIDKLIEEGHIIETEAGKYETDLLNMLCASDSYQAAIDSILSGLHGLEDDPRELSYLRFLCDLNVLDFAYKSMFENKADTKVQPQSSLVDFTIEEIIETIVRELKNREALKKVVKQYYPQIKRHIMNNLPFVKTDNKSRVLAVSLGRAMIIDEELADIFFKILEAEDEDPVGRSIAKYVLIETGTLIEGKTVLQRRIDDLLALNTKEAIFGHEFSEKIKAIPRLIEELREFYIDETALDETRIIVIELFKKYKHLQKDEIKNVLENLLNEFVKIAEEKYELYKEVDAIFDQSRTWGKFRDFCNFFKKILSGKNARAYAGSLPRIERLMERYHVKKPLPLPETVIFERMP